MERGRKNRVKSKFNMKSPFSQVGGTYNPGNLETKGESGEGIYEDASNNVYDPSNTDADFLDWKKNITQAEYDRFKQMGSGNTPPPESTDTVEPVEEKGIDRWIDKPIMEVLGLTKKQREARKLKKSNEKAEKLKTANEAIESGTQTLKQQKLVDRTNKKNLKKQNKILAKRTKDQKNLAKYQEKQAKKNKNKNIIKTDYNYPNTTV